MTKLEAGIERDQAFALLNEHNKEEFHIEHAETLEGTLRYFAQEFDPENVEFWSIVGLLHDLDWEEYPELEVHTLKAEPWLREAGGTDELVHAIQSHNFAAEGCPDPELFMEKVLYATDELTGLIGAAVLMRPSASWICRSNPSRKSSRTSASPPDAPAMSSAKVLNSAVGSSTS